MKWEMEIQEVETALHKIWDLHDKLSHAIHSISRTHFLNSTKSLKTPDTKHQHLHHFYHHDDNNGFVFVKDYDRDSSPISDAKSLTSIRSALENLEDQLEFFHTVQMQQRSERDVALARLEQSRIVLALRLAEHSGKKYKVIEEAMDFIGDIRDASCFVGPEDLSNPPASAPAEHSMQQKFSIKSNFLVRVLFSGLDSAKRTLQLDKMGGVVGNAALFALSMLTLLHLHQAAYKDNMLEIGLKQDRTGKKLSRLDSSSTGQLSHLDVRLARG